MNLLSESWFWWAVALAVGVPVLLVVLTEVLSSLQRRDSPLAGPVRLLRNWVVPAGALLGLLAFAQRSPADQVWVRVVATILGFLLILLVLSAFNVALFANPKVGSWRARMPTIFIEIARLILVVVGLALLFSWVWEADVGGLVAALGVTSIVIGLALQNAVGGVISGLLLLFEQPFKLGDWLEVSSASGRVVEVNWRAVHIDTGSGIQIVPNSSLASASFTNRSRPEGTFFAATTVTFTTDDPPSEVMALLVEVADSLPMRRAGAHATAGYAGSAKYSVSIPIDSPAHTGTALTVYLAWLWFAARRRGFALDGDSTDPIAEPAQLERALDVIAPTLHLRDDDRELLKRSSRLKRYGVGEVVLRAGILPNEISFIVAGRAGLHIDAAGTRINFDNAESGDFIGHTALTRELTQATVTALDVLTVLAVPLETLDELVRTRPRLATEIGQALDFKRQRALEALTDAGLTRADLNTN